MSISQYLIFITLLQCIVIPIYCNATLSPPLTQQPQLIIDTDSGFDDLFALTLLLGSPTLSSRIKLITTVDGMTDSVVGASVVRRLVRTIVGEESGIRVVAGAEEGQEGRSITDYEWGREYRSGFDEIVETLGLVEDDGKGDEEEGSVDAAAEALVSVLSSNQPTTVLTLGPYTNIAAAMSKIPPPSNSSTENQSQSPKRNLTIMGGAVHCEGNMGPNNEAELNFWSAPSAAHAVLHYPASQFFQLIQMADLCTANDLYSNQIASFITSRTTKNPTIAAGIIISLVEGWKDSCVYDPIASSFLLNPGVLTTEKELISVDGVTGVTTEVKEGGEEGAVMLDLAMDFNVDSYLAMIGRIMDGEDDAPVMSNVAVVAQGIANAVNNIIDSNYGTPPPTPAPTEEEDTVADDIVNKITEAASNIADTISTSLNP